MEDQTKIEVRDLRNGNWYWIDKAILREYAPKVRALGIAVYNLLASLADGRQTCFPSQKYIGQRLGYSRATINKAIKGLENLGLIRIEKRGRYHCVYQLLKVRCKEDGAKVSSRGNPDVTQGNPTNNKIARTTNIEIGHHKILSPNSPPLKGFHPKDRQELLALDLAESLNDLKALPLYLWCVRRYPEPLLRKILGEVKEIPAKKIKKSRGALFNHLIQTYDKGGS